jgi:RHS repeat-associated protein
MLDLNGDGKADVLISEDNVFTWYESTGKDGFENMHRTAKSYDEEAGPNIVFADSTQSIFLADMSGDGLSDIVRIRNGEVYYWPNLGYGKFGAKVAMDNAPWFDRPEVFNPSYLRLADIDGSGTPDIIYLGKNKFSCWSNLSGNSFSTVPFEMGAFPEIHTHSKVTVTDLLGHGVACIVWNSTLPNDANSPLKYIDLMNSKKPYIMVGYKNNMGKEVWMDYKSSTHFYIEDKIAGKPWVTKLHFPVHCVSKTESCDKISGYRFVSSYKYHHGYYDHAEREFRGFGMVEQTDAEHFENWVKATATNIVEEELHQEPIVSKTWVHTGAFLNSEKILTQFAHEYWYKEMERQDFPVTHYETTLPEARLITAPGIDPTYINELTAKEWQEALRACKGMSLRSEVFAKDAAKYGNTEEARKKELTPFSVATHNCVIKLLQPKGQNKHAVFIVKESEAITYSYERNTADPRIAHNLNIKLDEYGNVLESAAIVYPRIIKDITLPNETKQAQNELVISYVENAFTKDIYEDNMYRLRLPSEIKTYELIYNLEKIITQHEHFTIADFKDILSSASIAEYHEIDKRPTGETPQKRLIEHIRTIYRSNTDLHAALPLHQLESLALPFESYQLAYTPDLITDIYGTKVTAALLTEGKFTHSEEDTNWWIRSGTTRFIEDTENVSDAQNRFYAPISYTDPYGSTTKVKYYRDYFLFIKETEDESGNKSSVDLFNFRTLSSQRMKDINDNLSEVISDELGLVKAMAIMGKGTQADDLDLLTETTSEAEQNAIVGFFTTADAIGVCDSTALQTKAKQLLQNATARFVYDFDIYKGGINKVIHKPAVVTSIIRETHHRKENGSLNPVESKLQLSFEYSNGLGKVIMKKSQAEAGKAKQLIVNADNTITITEPDTAGSTPKQLRWIGNGRAILNNKGNAVKQYEAFFSVSPKFENEKELVETGVTPIMYYDAMDRLVKTKMPDGTFSKVEFDTWKQLIFDTNDTVHESSWYSNRANRLIDVQLLAEGKDPAREKIAADKAYKHAGTPNILHFDTLGRPVLSVDHNRNSLTDVDEFYHTQIKLDAEGNLRSVTDARGNVVMQYKYDILGTKVYQQSMDAGQRWLMVNSIGNPLRTWDERDHEFQYFYDILHRPLYSLVKGGDIPGFTLDHIFDRIFYGENEPGAKQKNLLGKPIRHYDTGGLVEIPGYDFKGQAISTTRKLFKNYKKIANWIDTNLQNDLENEAFTFITETDALGRISKQITPDESIITPSYNEAGLLNGETVLHPDSTEETSYIKDIDYNEKGQRTKIIYGNNVTTNYKYDKETFRLKSLRSFHSLNGATVKTLQDLKYTYDPVGNITFIKDDAHDPEFFSNQIIEPISSYTYDGLYRLTEATGRENAAALNFDNADNWNDAPFMRSNPMDVKMYTQRYKYDAVGNIQEMKHVASANNWTRTYEYETINNRLKSTSVGQEPDTFTYLYPHHAKHGFIMVMPHLENMGWNFKEELIKTIKQKVDPHNGTAETTYYQYDGQGQRIRKITENSAQAGADPTKKDERIYISGYETYRTYTANIKNFERESLSLMDKEHRFVMIETIKENVDPLASPSEKAGVRLTRYQLHNYLGSAALELDNTAQIISYEEYHPYGTTAYQVINKDIKCAAKRYRYTGMERDEETGLEYHSARYYLPWLGRWLSCDPIGIGDGVNIYEYCKANPINTHDRTGHWGWREAAVVVAIVVVGTVLTVATAGAAAPLLVGAVATIGFTGTAATVVTGIAVGAVAGAVGGFAGGVAGEVTRQTVNHSALGLGNEAYDGGRILDEGISGAETGALIGAALGGAAAYASTAAGAAVIGATGRAIRAATPTLSRLATSAARSTVTLARSAARLPGVRQVVQSARSVLGAAESSGQRAGLSLARRIYRPGSTGGRAVERFAGTSSLAETFGARPPSRPPGVRYSQQYRRLEIEVRDGRALKPSGVTDEMNRFLREGPHSSVDPRTGQPSPDRIFSADGTRSVRYGEHEMTSGPSRQHYHEEVWGHYNDTGQPVVFNNLRRFPVQGGSQ